MLFIAVGFEGPNTMASLNSDHLMILMEFMAFGSFFNVP